MKEHAENELKPAGNTPEHAENAPARTSYDASARTVLPWKRLAGAFLAGIPFFFTLPYTIQAWRSSTYHTKTTNILTLP